MDLGGAVAVPAGHLEEGDPGLYSMGYMHEDPHRPRFFAYLSLFTFAMLMLVTSDSRGRCRARTRNRRRG
jgi:hypothetical protein